MKAIQVSRFGGPEVLEVTDIGMPEPGPREMLVKAAANGVNYVDVYTREGQYDEPVPLILGLEGAGTVVSLGPAVSEFSLGDRVAWAVAAGSYAQYVIVDENAAVAVPPDMPLETAAAVMLQGMAAHFLCTSTFPISPGDCALVHAAAGGVGHLLTQMIKMRGGRVIATVSTGEKEELARQAGADEVIRYDQADFVAETRRLTGGAGVDVVYDGVGQATFEGSLACLRVRGYLVVSGGASGQVHMFDLNRLNPLGSLFVTRPGLVHHRATREELLSRANDVLGWVGDGSLHVRIGSRYRLDDVRHAHEDLQARRTLGKVLLDPW